MSDVMSIEEIEALPSFRELTEKQRALVRAYVATGDKVRSTMSAYDFKTLESARLESYALFSHPKIVRCLNEVAGMSAKDQFAAEIDQAIRNPKVTLAQVQALIVKGKLLGVLQPDYEAGASQE